MNQNIVRISDLSNYSNSQLENVGIKASVSIRSLRHGNDRHGYFYMDLRDDSGDIPAVAYINNEPCDNQLHLIQDNRTYTFTNFSLANSNKRYTSIPHEKEIVLNEESVIKLCGNACKVEWPLTPLTEIYNLETPNFFNIVGLCTGVPETEVVHGEMTRKVTLVNEARSEVVLNVSSQETSLFDELDLNFHPVLLVKDARIHKYRGTMSVTTTRYLQLLHPDDPSAVKIRRAIQKKPLSNVEELPGLNADCTVVTTPDQPAGYPYCTPSNFTRKNHKYLTIADLARTTNTDNVTLIATVTLKSTRLTGYSRGLHIDLRDDSGEIVAAADHKHFVNIHNFIQKNQTYSFTRFTLNDAERYTSIPHRCEVYLDENSEVKLCGIAPKVEWPLSPLTVKGKNGMDFYQAFGLFTRIQKKMVTLVDQLGRELFLEVDDEYMSMFDALDLDSNPVFFVKDARVMDKRYKGNLVLRTDEMAYLELLEPDEPRARRVTEALCAGSPHYITR